MPKKSNPCAWTFEVLTMLEEHGCNADKTDVLALDIMRERQYTPLQAATRLIASIKTNKRININEIPSVR